MRVWLHVVGVLGLVAWLNEVALTDEPADPPALARRDDVEALRQQAQWAAALLAMPRARDPRGVLLDTFPREREMANGGRFDERGARRVGRSFQSRLQR